MPSSCGPTRAPWPPTEWQTAQFLAKTSAPRAGIGLGGVGVGPLERGGALVDQLLHRLVGGDDPLGQFGDAGVEVGGLGHVELGAHGGLGQQPAGGLALGDRRQQRLGPVLRCRQAPGRSTAGGLRGRPESGDELLPGGVGVDVAQGGGDRVAQGLRRGGVLQHLAERRRARRRRHPASERRQRLGGGGADGRVAARVRQQLSDRAGQFRQLQRRRRSRSRPAAACFGTARRPTGPRRTGGSNRPNAIHAQDGVAVGVGRLEVDLPAARASSGPTSPSGRCRCAAREPRPRPRRCRRRAGGRSCCP